MMTYSLRASGRLSALPHDACGFCGVLCDGRYDMMVHGMWRYRWKLRKLCMHSGVVFSAIHAFGIAPF